MDLSRRRELETPLEKAPICVICEVREACEPDNVTTLTTSTHVRPAIKLLQGRTDIGVTIGISVIIVVSVTIVIRCSNVIIGSSDRNVSTDNSVSIDSRW